MDSHYSVVKIVRRFHRRSLLFLRLMALFAYQVSIPKFTSKSQRKHLVCHQPLKCHFKKSNSLPTAGDIAHVAAGTSLLFGSLASAPAAMVKFGNIILHLRVANWPKTILNKNLTSINADSLPSVSSVAILSQTSDIRLKLSSTSCASGADASVIRWAHLSPIW